MFSNYKFDQELLDALKAQDFDEMDDDSPTSQIESEVDDALRLILMEVISPDVFNTRDWVKECRERLKDPKRTPTILRSLVNSSQTGGATTPDLPYQDEENRHWHFCDAESLEYLEEQWSKHNERYYRLSPEVRDIITAPSTLTSAEVFVHEIMNGIIPPPEILLAVANCLDLYFRSAGSISLEHVFFGKEKKGAGNYSSRASRGALFRVFHEIATEEKAMAIGTNRFDSIEVIATRYLDNRTINTEDDFPDIAAQYEDVQSFLRGYNRWKKRHVKQPDS